MKSLNLNVSLINKNTDNNTDKNDNKLLKRPFSFKNSKSLRNYRKNCNICLKLFYNI